MKFILDDHRYASARLSAEALSKPDQNKTPDKQNYQGIYNLFHIVLRKKKL